MTRHSGPVSSLIPIMLTLILCLVAAVSGQYPYPPAAPAGETLQPYPPPVEQAVTVHSEGPYPPARAVEIPRPQPVIAAVPRPQPVIAAVPRPQPVIAAVPRPQPVIAYTPAVQPVLVRKVPVQPYTAQFSRYQYQPTPTVQIRPLQNTIVETPKYQPYRAVQPAQTIRVQDSPYPAARAPIKQPYAEGGELSPGELDAPVQPTIRYGVPHNSGPSGSGGDLSPDELELPPNTQINLQDDRLQYSHGFSDDKGTQVKEQGSLLSTNEGWEYVIAKKGSYSYVSPEGTPITVNYIADHNGYRVLPN